MKRWLAGILILSFVLLMASGDALGYRRHGSRTHFGLGLSFVIPIYPAYARPYYPYYADPYCCPPYPRPYYRYYPILLDAWDLDLVSRNTQHALENIPSGEKVTWVNSGSGVGGYVIPRPAFQNSRGQNCREFERGIAYGTRLERSYGTACRLPDGYWTMNPALP